MYTRTDSPAHIIQEVIDNSADEALGGHAKNLHVLLHLDGSITVTDDGRGIPVGLHPDEKIPVVVLAFTRLHAGGKFDKSAGNSAYAFSGGLHGVGVAVTNALSTRVSVEVRREGKIWTIEFSGGGENMWSPDRYRSLRSPERHPGARLARSKVLRRAACAASGT
jgi:topoisomerase-4 subunit B